MRKSGRNIELPFVGGRKGYTQPLTKGWGIVADVNGDIKHLAVRNVDKFALRLRILKMESAQSPFPRIGQIVLDKLHIQSMIGVTRVTPCFKKVSSFVTKDIWLDNDWPQNICFDYLHN